MLSSLVIVLPQQPSTGNRLLLDGTPVPFIPQILKEKRVYQYHRRFYRIGCARTTTNYAPITVLCFPADDKILDGEQFVVVRAQLIPRNRRFKISQNHTENILLASTSVGNNSTICSAKNLNLSWRILKHSYKVFSLKTSFFLKISWIQKMNKRCPKFVVNLRKKYRKISDACGEFRAGKSADRYNNQMSKNHNSNSSGREKVVWRGQIWMRTVTGNPIKYKYTLIQKVIWSSSKWGYTIQYYDGITRLPSRKYRVW